LNGRLQTKVQRKANMSQSASNSSAALVIGSGGGIGAALIDALVDDHRFEHVYAFSRSPRSQKSEKSTSLVADTLDSESMQAALKRIAHPLTRVIVTTGMLHDDLQSPEKSWRALDAYHLSRSFMINSIAPILALKAVIPLLPRDRRCEVAALGARVGSISDNRNGGWYGYRASKAALAMLIKTLSLELARTHPSAVCALLHPGTVDTAMSKPFQSGVVPEKLFTPAQSAAAMLAVLDSLTPADSGNHFAWDGTPIPA
jgi:NAD(P)-dependent dehydrogenase (short-subunit alcohol dehydrogenase family)